MQNIRPDIDQSIVYKICMRVNIESIFYFNLDFWYFSPFIKENVKTFTSVLLRWVTFTLPK